MSVRHRFKYNLFFEEEVDIFVYNLQPNNFLLQKDEKKLGNGENFCKSFNDSESVFSLGSSNEKKKKLYLFFIQKWNKPICP